MKKQAVTFFIMNGIGNRFAIFDARQDPDFELSDEQVRTLATPGGVFIGEKGADQVIIMRQAHTSGGDTFMEIRNRRGFEVAACGNATRCVAWLYLRETGQTNMRLATQSGILDCEQSGPFNITVDMGIPKLDWQDIPLKEAMHTHHMDIKIGPIDAPVLYNPGAVNMGNPHCVFFVRDFNAFSPEKVGAMVEFHPLFPEQVNVSFARVEDRTHIRLKVWERGVGLTQACGTGACAAVVAAVRQKRTERQVQVRLDGGTLDIDWHESNGHVMMRGAVELEGEGKWTL